jgi:hypothetical protein
MSRKVRVVIDPNGKARVEWEGYEGPACLVAADRLREVLDAKYGIKNTVEKFEAKPELEAALDAEALRERQKESE